MSAKEHNNTLVMLYAAIGMFYSCGIIASPWIVETNFRKPGQIPTAIIVFGLVLLIGVLFLSSAICVHRRKPIGENPSTLRCAHQAASVLAGGSLFLVVPAYCRW